MGAETQVQLTRLVARFAEENAPRSYRDLTPDDEPYPLEAPIILYIS
jgi:hypothetical protein